VWDDVRIDRVLPYKESRDPEDERHVHPLQLDVIERACVLWSNPGEVVLSPFMGVGSEVYGAVLNGRRGIGIELKASYYEQAVKNLRECKPEAENGELFNLTHRSTADVEGER
jgi:DNA modification methylase